MRSEITGIVLHGPPAAGKDTITGHLTDLDRRYVHFRRLKAGPGRSEGYRVIGVDEFAAIRTAGGLLYENSRYDAFYGVDRDGLEAVKAAGRVPVVHIGQVAGIEQVIAGTSGRWLVVGLWCSRAETARRLELRLDKRPSERLAAWDETLKDLRAAQRWELFDLNIRTDRFGAATAARLIHAAAEQ